MTAPMPVFVIKASDHLAVSAIEAYRDLCVRSGLFGQAKQVAKAREEVEGWRERNPRACRWPDHGYVPAGEPESGSES